MRPQRSRARGLNDAGARIWIKVAVVLAAGASCADTTTPSHVGWRPAELQAEERCQQGTIAACSELGRSLIARTDSERNVERGLVLLEMACGQDDLPACTALGHMYIDHSHDKARARARELLTRACTRGSAGACTGLGQVLQIDHAGRSEVAAAFQKGCDGGDAEGCERFGGTQIGDTFGDGRAIAEEAFGRACGLGKLSSCHQLAMVQLDDPSHGARALALLKQNCARGFVRSCSLLATASAPLLVRRPSCDAAQSPARRACEGKDDDACAIVDACALAGPAHDATLERLGAACARGTALGCLYWADAQAAGADPARVEQAYTIACKGRSVAARVACPRLAVIALARVTLSVDAERPLATLRDACEHSSGEACCALADEYERGKWVQPDAIKTSELRAKACTLGQDRCCRSQAWPEGPRSQDRDGRQAPSRLRWSAVP